LSGFTILNKFFEINPIVNKIKTEIKNLLRIVKPDNLNYTGFFPKIIYTNKSDINKIELDNFAYFESVKMCGYSNAPCTHYLKQKLKSKKYYNYKVILTY